MIEVERKAEVVQSIFVPGKLVESEITGHIYLVIEERSKNFFEGVRLYSGTVTVTAKVPEWSNTFMKDDMKAFTGKITIEN